MSKKKTKKITAEEFDEMFDRGEDISDYVDFSKARRIHSDIKRVNIDFPLWVVESLDQEAKRLGITRQSLVKMWIAERIDSKTSD